MQTTRIVQAVILMTIVAMAASCAASKEYTSKLFVPRMPEAKDSQAVAALRFLDIDVDSTRAEQDGWVTTDIIMGRDTITNTVALDKLAKTIPVTVPASDTTSRTPPASEPVKATQVLVSKPAPVETEPVARASNPGEVRNKKTREK